MTRLSVSIGVALLSTACIAPLVQKELHQTTGKLRLLVVGDGGPTYDESLDRSDSRVVVQLDTELEKTFEFPLRPGRHETARRSMFDLLRDALKNDKTVVIDYSIEGGNQRHVIHRVSLTSEPSRATVRVTEVLQPFSTADDPILKGGRLDPSSVLAQLPSPPPEFKGTGAHELLESTKLTFLEETPLGAGQTREAAVSFDEPVLLQARATWFGAVVPATFTVSMAGKTLATGKVHPAPPNRGTATVDVQIPTPGSATVSFLNKGSEPVQVRMVVGLLPLSVVRNRDR